MKKYFTTVEYKVWQKRRVARIHRRPKRTKKYHPYFRYPPTFHKPAFPQSDLPIFAPSDFRLIENTEECLTFFRSLRNEVSEVNGKKYVLISLLNVIKIDYGTISILTAISDDLKTKHVSLRGDFPNDRECTKFMIESGFLNNMYNKGKKYPKVARSELVFFEKGSGVLSMNDNKKISDLVKNVVNHLIGEQKYCLPVKTIILEICGNSIEWGGTENKQWLLGVRYDTERVIFTVTDVGRGILETLNRKFFKYRLIESVIGKPDHAILNGAFDQKYGSNTQEANRNKGLPAVKSNFNDGTIQYLKVLTNNVILHFDDDAKSKTFAQGSARFKGTFYQWEMTKDCLNNLPT